MPPKFWELPDEVWTHVEPWIPGEPDHRRGWRRRVVNNRKRMEAMVFQMKTSCRWEALPESFGDPMRLEPLHRTWYDAGVFHVLFFALLHHHSAEPDADLSWCVPDGVGAVLVDFDMREEADEGEPLAFRPGAFERPLLPC